MQKPVIPFTLAYVAGLLLGYGFLFFPYSISVVVVMVVVAGTGVWKTRELVLANFILITLACFTGMCLYLFSAAWFPANHYTRKFPADKTLHALTGSITSPLDRDPERTGFVLTLGDIDGTSVSGVIRVNVREALQSAGYGDIVRIRGKLLEPGGFRNPGGFDYPAYLAQRGIYYTAGVAGSDDIMVVKQGSGLLRTIQDWREQIRQAFLQATTGPGSAILQAMVLGEEGGLTDEMRDRFMAAGVTHIISISGSHLGMVAILCFGLIRGLLFLLPMRWYNLLTIHADPKKIAAWLTLPIVILYTLLAGSQVATVRSLIMISAALAAILLDRENALMHSLAVAALIILCISPQALFDISFQLSYLSVIVIGYVVALWTELQIQAATRLQKIRNDLILLTAISLSTSIATAPLVAHYFNQVSCAGIISNMIVVPFAGMVVVPLGLFSGILSLGTHHLPFAALNQLAADLFINVVYFFSHIPFAELHPPSPGVLGMICIAVFLFSFTGYIKARLVYRFKPFESSFRVSPAHFVGMAISGGAMLLLILFTHLPNKDARITFLDVGQGDCTLIELPSGRNILIDGGGSFDDRFDIGRRVVGPYLWNRGIGRLDLVILSHPHPDHLNGLRALVQKFWIAEVWDSGLDSGLKGYGDFKKDVIKRNIRYRALSADDPPIVFYETELRVLHPSHGFVSLARKAYDAENNRSLVVQVKYRDQAFIFSGDIGAEAEQEVVKNAAMLPCDLLKVPHHGSRTSSSEAFVAKVNPRTAVITVGKGNWYRHPSEEVVARYEANGTRLFRTDQQGAIVVFARKNGLSVLPWNEAILARIAFNNQVSWWDTEKRNWKSLRLRLSAT